MNIGITLGRWAVIQADLTEVEGVIWALVLTILGLLTGWTILA